MTKRTELGEKARNLYVMHHLTLKEIGVRLAISERTLGNWKAADAEEGPSWDEQRGVSAGAEGGLHAELQRLAAVVARSIRTDLEDGKQIDDRVYQLDKLLAGALKSKKLDKEKPPDDKRSPEQIRTDAARQLREVMGV